MPLISVTRLRLRSARFLPGFAWYALRSGVQARRAPGFSGLRVLNERPLVFWTMTVWDERDSMKAYRSAGSHKAAMRRLAGWCDEAAYVRWSDSLEPVVDWAAAHLRMLTDGHASHVLHPSPAQSAKAWAPPARGRSVLEA